MAGFRSACQVGRFVPDLDATAHGWMPISGVARLYLASELGSDKVHYDGNPTDISAGTGLTYLGDPVRSAISLGAFVL